MNQTFGAFVRQKRMAQGISLRGLAARLGLSPVYMSIIETDRKPAPAKEHLDRLAEELHLSKEERELFLDLAAPRKWKPLTRSGRSLLTVSPNGRRRTGGMDHDKYLLSGTDA